MDSDPLPSARYNIVRFFGYGDRHVSFSLSRVEDIFELQVPRLQIVRSGMPSNAPKSDLGQPSGGDEEKRVLRNEIKAWWQAVAEHIDKIVSIVLSWFGVPFYLTYPVFRRNN
jgi:1-phosphatidylinositol-3-phosphate 5-kinase